MNDGAVMGTERLRGEDGFTLVELLIATVIGLAVIGTAVASFASGIRSEPRIRDRTAAIQSARVTSERLSRELRQGSNATSVTPSQLMILTYVPHSACGAATTGTATRCRVFYSCDSAGACTRIECPPNLVAPGAGCGPTVRVVEGLASNQVFSFSPRIPGQAYVGFGFAFAAENGDDAITLEDGVALRNPPLGGP